MKTIEHKLFLERVVKPIASNLFEKKELDTNVFYLAGSRTGGKTRLLFFLISLILNFYNKNDELLKADCYFFRSTKDATKESFSECLDN
jgi:predicted AAA+ superfamily ATPase